MCSTAGWFNIFNFWLFRIVWPCPLSLEVGWWEQQMAGILLKNIYCSGIVYWGLQYFQFRRERPGILGTSQHQRRSNQSLICRTSCILSYMFFTAPDFWRNREHRSVFSFCCKVLILLHILFAGSHGVLFAGEKALLEFSDNDSRGGWLSGD